MTEPSTDNPRVARPGEMLSIAVELCRLASWFQYEKREEISVRLVRNAEWFLRLRASHGRLRLDSIVLH